MQSLRNAHHLIRFVLVWFALSIGVAIASPLVKPQPMQLICSTAGSAHLVIQTEEGVKPVTGNTLDCPLCIPFTAPPARASFWASALPLVSHFQPVYSAVPVASSDAAPFPARGPPAFL